MYKLPTEKSASRIVEETLCSALHGIGAIFALVGLVAGLYSLHGSMGMKIGFAVYAASLSLLMLMSCLSHALSFSRANRVFLILDFSSIFVLIAGSYTPFIIRLYDGWLALMLLLLVWTIAAGSIAVNASIPKVMERASMVFYICFGWLAVLFIPKLHVLSPDVLWLMVTGGLLYTIGAVLMAISKPFFHLGWHALVLAAAVCHFIAIIRLF